MTSIKVKFRPSLVRGKEGSIYYQIIRNRVVRQLKTGYRYYQRRQSRTLCLPAFTSATHEPRCPTLEDNSGFFVKHYRGQVYSGRYYPEIPGYCYG